MSLCEDLALIVCSLYQYPVIGVTELKIWNWFDSFHFETSAEVVMTSSAHGLRNRLIVHILSLSLVWSMDMWIFSATRPYITLKGHDLAITTRLLHHSCIFRNFKRTSPLLKFYFPEGNTGFRWEWILLGLITCLLTCTGVITVFSDSSKITTCLSL